MKKKTKPVIYFLLFILLISCEKSIEPDKDPDSAKIYKELDITSIPAGARVYINGKNSGYKTPCRIKWIEAEGVSVKLKLDPYYDYEKTLNAEELNSSSLYYDFTLDDRNFGTVICSINPSGSEIYINGENSGKRSPFTFTNIRPGKHSFQFRSYNHRDYSIDIDVPIKKRNEDIVELSATLIDTSLFVDYTRELPFTACNHILSLPGGELIISTLQNGLYSYSVPDKMVKKLYSGLLPTERIKFTYADSRGGLWVGTSAGILRIKPDGSAQLINSSNSELRSNEINGIVEDKYGIYWFATDIGLYNLYKDPLLGGAERIDNISFPQEYDDLKKVSSLGKSSLGVLWIAYPFYNRVFTYNWNTALANIGWTAYSVGTGDTKIFCAPGNKTYLYTEYTCTVNDNGIWKSVATAGYNSRFNAFYADQNGNAFLATPTSIRVIKSNGAAENISLTIPGLYSTPVITSIAMDERRNIWLSTLNYGIVRLKYFNR